MAWERPLLGTIFPYAIYNFHSRAQLVPKRECGNGNDLAAVYPRPPPALVYQAAGVDDADQAEGRERKGLVPADHHCACQQQHHHEGHDVREIQKVDFFIIFCNYFCI